MALRKPGKVSWHNILDAPFVHFAGRYVPSLYQFAQPSGGEWINLVVVDDTHRIPLSEMPRSRQRRAACGERTRVSGMAVPG
jgi:hypothetical protein